MTPEQFEQAKRELQRKYARKTYGLDPTTLQREPTGYDINFMIDLTALLEQHKEMMLREELIKYDEWVFENGKAFADTKESIDEYIEYLKNVKKSLTPICAYRESTGGCIPGCGTDSCMYHPNNR